MAASFTFQGCWRGENGAGGRCCSHHFILPTQHLQSIKWVGRGEWEPTLLSLTRSPAWSLPALCCFSSVEAGVGGCAPNAWKGRQGDKQALNCLPLPSNAGGRRGSHYLSGALSPHCLPPLTAHLPSSLLPWGACTEAQVASDLQAGKRMAPV